MSLHIAMIYKNKTHQKPLLNFLHHLVLPNSYQTKQLQEIQDSQKIKDKTLKEIKTIGATPLVTTHIFSGDT